MISCLFSPAPSAFCYDMRGHGQSCRTPSVFRDHDDLYGLLRTHSATPALLMGHSLGARAAINFALEYPQAVRALVLVEPGLAGHPFSDQIERATSKMIGALSSSKPEQAAEIFIRVRISEHNVRCARANNCLPATSAIRPVIVVAILYYLNELDIFARYIDHG